MCTFQPEKQEVYHLCTDRPESTSFEKALKCTALSNGLKCFSIQEMIIQDEEGMRNMLYEMANNFSFEQKVTF